MTTLKPKFQTLQHYVSLTKPRIALMSVMLAWTGIVFARENYPVINQLSSLLGIGLLVSGSSVLNMFLERDYDLLMARTKNRALPSKAVSPYGALLFGLILSGASIPLLYYSSNPLTTMLGFAALFAYVCVYTPLKRISSWALVVGAFPGAMPALLGYVAAKGSVDWAALAIFGIAFFWQLPHFIAITIFRGDEYEFAGFPVVAKVVGLQQAKNLILATSILLVANSFALMFLKDVGQIYAVCCCALGIWFVLTCAKGLWLPDILPWSKKIFKDSLIYQTLLYAAILADVGLHELLL